MRTLLRVLLLALAFTAGTAFLGWWSVPLLALVWGVIAWRLPRVALTAGGAAMLAWGVLLVAAARAPAFGALARSLADVMQLPSVALVVLTLLFPALVGWSAARTSASLTALVLGRRLPDERQGDPNAARAPAGAGSSAGDRPREVYATK